MATNVSRGNEPSRAADARQQRLLAIVGAVIATVVIWVIAVLVGDVNLEAKLGSNVQDINLFSVILGTAIWSLIAWGVLTLIE